MRKFGPKSADHPSVGEPCPVCGKPFQPNDFTTLEVTHAADQEEARKAQAGRPFTSAAIEVHWECRADPGGA